MRDNPLLYILVKLSLVLLCFAFILHYFFANSQLKKPQYESAKAIDSYKNVLVYNNGPDYTANHGENFSSDGYYYGLKWQCVEFVKRFYHDVKHVNMPNGFGNAKDFFDPAVPQGHLNGQRDLLQYRNGGNMEPKPDDILVFTNGLYGHVAIVTKVTPSSVEIIQQNEKDSRQVLSLTVEHQRFFVGSVTKPAGWLRKAE
ncbi:CHAP domain-containing protein [Candidatus Desulfosporosinus nitrosoreducens]|uniref:CHAP domain-containing protein n=1 Tax=Candidatus Desulfosporosinus nitrosoreducens TaxID=3401928 RepID=UPI00280AA298|nr:CHAP domain-containing protein [Desulfosporosinus sp. PR]